jgi:heterodisulfide reductase subunit A2
MIPLQNNPVGKVMVVGGGIGGIQAALDLADTGFYVYLLDKSQSVGGTMAQLDKTFPTNDCSTCIFSPKLVEAAGHHNIKIMTLCELMALEGVPGHFTAHVRQMPRYINIDKCIACGQCAEKCPKKVPDSFNTELGMRKAAYIPFPQAVPLKYALDPDHCLYLTKKKCGLCKKICPVEAVEFDQEIKNMTLEVGAVILSAGFELSLTKEHGEYGFGRYRNVVTSLQYERMLSATGPYGGHLRRPSDGKSPRRVAWIQCVMSRDISRNRPFCSSVCCMHAAKQAVLTRSHLPESEAVIYFMDIRAHGKGFDEYIERASFQYQVRYKRSMISQLYLNPRNENLVIETFDHHINDKVEEEYDLVVLSSGFQPVGGWINLADRLNIQLNPYGFACGDFDEPVSTSRPGVYVCGAMESPKDIPETVIQAGAAAAEASTLLSKARKLPAEDENQIPDNHAEEKPEPEIDADADVKVGVFVCHCGSNIAGVVDIPSLLYEVKKINGVMFAQDFMFTCSAETQDRLAKKIKEHHLNRVVVAACSPKTHEPLFRKTLEQAGLNPYLMDMANIRNQCSWVHGKDAKKATVKALELIKAAVARAKNLEPLKEDTYDIINAGLVIGGGLAGMTAALTIAEQGFHVHLVEKTGLLGGYALKLTHTLEGHSPPKLARLLEERVCSHPNITLYLASELSEQSGYIGAFNGIVTGAETRHEISYGAVVVASGGRAYQPGEFRYEQDERVVTQVELATRLRQNPQWPKQLKSVVMIQCVGSRNETFAYCSRVCCSAAVKNAIALKDVNPDIQVIILYRDLRTFGFKELYYLEARRKGVLFFRFIPDEAPVVYDDHGLLVVDFSDRSSHQEFRISPDIVTLSTGIRPASDNEKIAGMLKLSRTPEGFFMEAHVKLRPVEFPTAGIFLAGLAHSPRFADEAVAMAKCAAQQAIKILCRDKMKTSATFAVVDPNLCTACLACVRVCPFGAPFINKEGVSEIVPAKCQGCGICPSECPARAITLKHSTDDQTVAEIDALLEKINFDR